MKKLIALVALLGLVLGMAATASAELDIKGRGSWRVQFNLTDNLSDFDFDDDRGEDDYNVQQRIRTRFRFVFNENVLGELYTEIGDITWGRGAGDLNTDGIAIEVKRAFIQWFWPETKVLFTAGLQNVDFPHSGAFNNMVFGGNDVGAFVVSIPVNEMIGVTLGYARPIDLDDEGLNDEFDIIMAAVPVTMDGVSITPWIAYSWLSPADAADTVVTEDYDGDGDTDETEITAYGILGSKGPGSAFALTLPQSFFTGISTDGDDDEESLHPWWIGLNSKVDMFDPFVFYFDFIYGAVANIDSTDSFDDPSLSGWMADLMFEYTGLDYFTPQLMFVYASGADEDDADDGEINLLPVISSGFNIGGTLVGGSNFTTDAGFPGGGFWLVGLALRDISFVEKLSHEIIFLYAQGTSDQETAAPGFLFSRFTEDESYFEVDFNHRYQIYESLAAILELAYANLDTDDNDFEDTFDGGDTDAVLKATFGFRYDF